MKNVLIISDYAAPYMGNFVPALEAIKERYHNGNIHLCFPESAKNTTWMPQLQDKHTVVFCTRKLFSKRVQWREIKHLYAYIRAYQIGIIHTHFVAGNLNLFLLAKITGVHMVANLHNHYIVSGRMGWLRKYYFLHTYHHIIGDSDSVSCSARAIGVKEDKLVTINNSIQFTRLNKFQIVDLRQKHQYALLMFGYPWHRKGVDIVVRSVNSLRKQGLDITLCLAQAGGVNEIRTGIKSIIGTIPKWIQFLPPTDALADYYNACDIFISAGREEGLSYSPIEAAYCSCGVICSKIGGNPLDIPLIKIYDTEDIELLSDCITKELALNIKEISDRNEIQRSYVLQHYNIENWAIEVIKTYL